MLRVGYLVEVNVGRVSVHLHEGVGHGKHALPHGYNFFIITMPYPVST